MLMLLKTNIDPTNFPWKIGYGSKLFFAGSCFADEMGKRFLDHKFHCLVNSLGIHFNPVSLSHSLEYLTGERSLLKEQLVQREGRWHHFDFHGVFSGETPENTLSAIHTPLQITRQFLEQSDFCFITLGTSQVHVYKPSSGIVANNHKFPAELFEARMLGQKEVEDALSGIIHSIKRIQPGVKIVFTVSQVRYLRNGMHANQLSKARLLLAVDAVVDGREIFYFPSYELFMDDLRDYRFYGDDLVHPARIGVDYTWDVLTKASMSEQTLVQLNQVKKLLQSFQHRPIYPESKEYRAFLQSLLWEMKNFAQQHQEIDFSDEMLVLEKKLVAGENE
jgi:hypothetical protein